MYAGPGQLDLFLPGVQREAWGGTRPRALTRGSNVVILTTRGGGHEVGLDQLDLFRVPWRRELKKRRPVGAPSLLPLPWERRKRR